MPLPQIRPGCHGSSLTRTAPGTAQMKTERGGHTPGTPELAGLIAALKEQAGVRVQRLSIEHGESDNIPHRLTRDQGHVVPVKRFSHHPRPYRQRYILAAGSSISLLVVPPGTQAGAARASMDLAATHPGTAQAADILVGRHYDVGLRWHSPRRQLLRAGRAREAALSPRG